MSIMATQAENRGGYRNSWLDFLKGIAIVAVVLYHMGILDYGYLGVDLFLIINGYLITNSILKSYEEGEFSYFRFVIKRIMRLWPLVLLAALVALLIGYFNMLPDDLENLGESVVASNVFANNILMSITAKDYWDTNQIYKALMHTWYLGVVVQFYIIYPLIVMAVHKFAKHFKKSLFYAILVVSILSLVCYLTAESTEIRFYYIHCRFYEFAAGGLLLISHQNGWLDKLKGRKSQNLIGWVSTFILIAFFVLNFDFVPALIKLLLVVLFSGISIACSVNQGISKESQANPFYKAIAGLGLCSYSIYIWHQVIIAFYRYIINSEPGVFDNLYCIILISLFSVISYFAIERNLAHLNKKGMSAVMLGCVIMCLITGYAGLSIYLDAGVVRDVPELDIYTTNIHRGMHAEYNDRVYEMDVEFDTTDTIKVLAIGNSYARDWINILLESDIADYLDISYIYSDDLDENYIERIKEADYVFLVGANELEGEYPNYLYESISSDACIYRIGTKQYGTTNGNVYHKRNRSDYLQSTVSFATVADLYEEERSAFGENYIDFIAPVLHEDGTISAFTDDGKFISQDCRHLTQGGAQFYAKIFDLNSIFDINED